MEIDAQELLGASNNNPPGDALAAVSDSDESGVLMLAL